MASVILDFTPEQGFTKLKIYESATKGGAPGALIETVTIDPNNPITRYTTSLATNASAWFSIQFEDDKGGTSPMSEPVQGGTMTLVGNIVNRVMLRDPSLDERVVTQEAEVAVAAYFDVADPYTLASDAATGEKMLGLVYLTIARSMIFSFIAGGSSESYTAGLVSQKASAGGVGSRDNIEWLLKWANRFLGMTLSYVMLLEEIDVTGLGTQSSISYDQSRLAITVNFE